MSDINKLVSFTLSNHEKRVSDLCILMGKQLNLNIGHLRILKYAALTHDLGKQYIDKKIIHKQGKLTNKEREKIKQHVRLSFNTLSEHDFNNVANVVVLHHEFIKDSYPRSIQKDRQYDKYIYLMGQILALCDIYDALVSTRSYKKSFDADTTESIIKKEFTGDVKLVNILFKKIIK
jgi:HD-GYP domain-containing protein (c-di-GMP phosphodiesterase class II)